MSIAGGALGVAGNFAAVPMSFIQSDEEKKKLAANFGSIERACRNNPALRAKCKDLDERWQGATWDSIFGIVGGMAIGGVLAAMLGGIFGTFAIPIPIFGSLAGSTILGLVGTIAGGIVGSNIYHSAFEKQGQDPIVINEQIIQMQKNGETIAPELVFACLAANISGDKAKSVDKLLKKYTETELFTEALGNPNNLPKLAAMMNNKKIDDIIRAQTQMPFNPQNPNKTVAEQYAELLNNGQMQAKDMLVTGAGLDSVQLSTSVKYASASPEVPNIPIQPREQTHAKV